MAHLTSDWVNSTHLGRDGFCRTPGIHAAMFRNCFGYSEHFSPGLLTSTTTYPGFTVTAITASSSGTLVMADRLGGWLDLTGGTHDGAGIQMQTDGEMYLPAAGDYIFFEASVKAADADDLDWFLGLSKTDTNVFSTDPASLIAFRGDDGDANIDFQVRSGGVGAQADTGSNLGDGTAVRLGFLVDGITSVTPFVNGAAGTRVTTNIPTEELTITYGMLNGGTTGNNTFGLDWVRVVQVL